MITEAYMMGEVEPLANLPMFCDQAPSRAQFFDLNDAHMLSAIPRDTETHFERAPNDEAQDNAATTHRDHQGTYAQRCEAVVLDTLVRRSR